MDREELQNKFNIRMTFLCYSSMLRSLPSSISNRSFKPTVENPILPYQLALIGRTEKLSRIVYSTIISDLRMKHRSLENKTDKKWLRDIGGMYKGTMQSICSVSRNTYFQSFHFRIISRIISTNRFLNIIGITADPLCDFCHLEIESIVHLFWGCTCVQRYVETVSAYLSETFNFRLNLNEKLCFFPTLDRLKPIEVAIITIAKVVIYSAKRRSQSPTLQHFQSALCLEAQKEHDLSVLRGIPETFQDKWGRIGTVIDICF